MSEHRSAAEGLAGKVAVVTGGSSGLGAAITTALEDGGAKVVVADLLGAPPVDVTRDDHVRELFAGLDRLDVLVLSAAVEVRKPLLDTTDEDWQRVLDVNLKGPFLCMRHGIPLMVRSGGGSVIALGSILGATVAPVYSAYCASKTGLVNLCKQAAIEHAPDGVRVNVVSPSACEAGLFLEVVSQAPDPDAIKRMVASRTPIGRLGTADDVCAAVLFLAGEGSSYVSGTVLPLDGGLAARRV
jgi:NAD(P)-dependent dehydrogenase (short-subunit alcohol dehydrogenase family)